MGKGESSESYEFEGFYLARALAWAGRGSFGGYVLASVVIVCVLAGGFTVLGFAQWSFSTIMMYLYLGFFLIVTYIANKIAIDNRDRIVESAKSKPMSRLAKNVKSKPREKLVRKAKSREKLVESAKSKPMGRLAKNVKSKPREKLVESAKSMPKEKFDEKAESKPQKKLLSKLNRLIHRYTFHPILHVMAALVLFIVGCLVAFNIGHLEYMLSPLVWIFCYLTGVNFVVFVGSVYVLHIVTTRIIGETCPIRALHPDRMGGYKFVADVALTVIVLVSSLTGFVVLCIGGFILEIPSGSGLFVVGTGIGLTFILSLYVYLAYTMHRGLADEKEQITQRITPLLINVENAIEGIAKGILVENIQNTEQWETIVERLKPYSMPILSLKAILDEVRHMRDWPIDVPAILKIIGGISASLIVIGLRVILQFLGIPLP